MTLRAFLVSFALVLPFGGAAIAQQEQTLADIRQELTVLFVEVQRLRTQLSTTGAPTTGVSGDSVLARLDAIEQEMRRLTATTETLQLRVERVVSDGTNKIGDLEFRLCELESDCDIGSLGDTPRLGGGDAAVTLPAPAPTPQAPTEGGQLAVGEQADFDRARAQYDAGEFAAAADAFDRFTQVYPGGPLAVEAYLLRGEALSQTGDWQPAARAYLEAFSLAPNGTRAPGALVSLGKSLGQLGQTSEACLTLTEVGVRFPGAPEIATAQAEQAALGC